MTCGGTPQRCLMRKSLSSTATSFFFSRRRIEGLYFSARLPFVNVGGSVIFVDILLWIVFERGG